MADNTNLEIDGVLDGSWQSYYGDKQRDINGSMSETVDATPKEAQGSETMDLLPDEIDAELTEKAERVVKTAVLHKDESSYDVADKLDEEPSNVRNILRNKCPEWYESTFKEDGSGVWKKDFDADDVAQAIAANDGMSVKELTAEFDTTPKTIRTRLEDIDDLWHETGPDGYHHTAKVYHVGETLTEELSDDDMDYAMPQPEELDRAPVKNEQSDVLHEVKTKAEAIKATHHEDDCARFAAHILEVLEDG